MCGDLIAPVRGPLAVARRDGGAKVGVNQRLLDPVGSGVAEPRLAGQPGKILAQPLRRAPEAAEQPFAPARTAHAAILVASIRSPSRAPIRTGMMDPGSAGAASVSAAKFSPWPLQPSRPTSICVAAPARSEEHTS